jgi:DNA-binding MarR family transcriptional regulator
VNEARSETPLAFAVVGALHGIEARLESALEPLGLSLAKLRLMSKLHAAGESLPLGTLAERAACVRSNITQLVDRLEADKLVRRVDDPRDRRSIRAELTDEGRARYEAGARALEKAEQELFGAIPQDQREALLNLVRTLHCRP